MRLTRTSALLLMLVAVAAAPAPAFADEPAVTIAIRDHQFVPSEVQIRANAKVELIIRNEQTTAAEFESTSLHREKVVAPGKAASVFVGPLKPGRYDFFDDFHPATRGVLVVQ
jgi:plastocyanin